MPNLSRASLFSVLPLNVLETSSLASSYSRLSGVLLRLLAVSAFCLAAGCSSSTNVANVVAQLNDANIKRAANLFGAAISRNDWRAPKDEVAFKEFIHDQMAPHKLAMMGVKPDAIDAIFVSERDGKPFKFRYGLTVAAMSTAPVVFEQVGINGRKQVGFSNGNIKEVDNAEYQSLWGEKGTAPATGETPPTNSAK